MLQLDNKYCWKSHKPLVFFIHWLFFPILSGAKTWMYLQASSFITMMPIIIQILVTSYVWSQILRDWPFCIKTLSTSKSPKWTGDSYKPKKYFGYNGKLIRKSIFIKKILEFLQKFKFQKQQSVATTEYSCLLHHDCLVNIIREN